MDKVKATYKNFRVRTRRGRSEFYRYLKDRYGLKPATSVIETCTINKKPRAADFDIGVVVGPSGSGKTSTVQLFRPCITLQQHRWKAGVPIMQHFRTPQQAERMMAAVALNNVPDWLQPYHKLSGGQKFRADLAMALERWGTKKNRRKYLVIDEYCSYLDDNTSKAISHKLQRHLRREGRTGVLIATLKPQLLPYLKPEWVLHTSALRCELLTPSRWPRLRLRIEMRHVLGSSGEVWKKFSRYHYLSHGFSRGAKSFVVYCNGEMCGFHAAVRHMCPKDLIFAHRTVVLPEFQGFGVGPTIHALMGAYLRRCCPDFKFRVITSHHNMIESMKRHPEMWKERYSGVKRAAGENFFAANKVKRALTNFEYVGPTYSKPAPRLWSKEAGAPRRDIHLVLKTTISC